ncbi:MAG TPA: hypothetical protein HA355_00685 [Methanosphaera sp.]|nr:hypothetical protein [Methanosphaera sp.]HII08089.1 hypothetical protein [Methanosphaera sp.]
MKKIEKNKNNYAFINELYENNKVLFEHTILESDKLSYSISYFAKKDIYDVLIKDKINSRTINYEARKKLSGSTLKYFAPIKGDVISDNFGNTFKCITHYIEYES